MPNRHRPPRRRKTTAIVDPPIEQAPVIPAPAPVSGLTMPKWSEFPVPPKDVPTPADIAVEVKTQNDKARGLTNEVAALNWDPEDAETVRKETVARLDPDMMKPLDQPMSATAIEAFAADLRRKAVPPPVAN